MFKYFSVFNGNIVNFKKLQLLTLVTIYYYL